MSVQQPLNQLKVLIEPTEDPKLIEDNSIKLKLLLSLKEITTTLV